MKKIIIYLFAVILATLFVAQFAAPIAANAALITKNEMDLKSYQFNLKNLQTEGQKQSYLFDKDKDAIAKEKGPLIAVIMKVINLMSYTIGSVALVALVLSGLWLVTSHGESSQIEQGKKIFLYALVGVVFAFASFIIVTFVQSLLK